MGVVYSEEDEDVDLARNVDTSFGLKRLCVKTAHSRVDLETFKFIVEKTRVSCHHGGSGLGPVMEDFIIIGQAMDMLWRVYLRCERFSYFTRSTRTDIEKANKAMFFKNDFAKAYDSVRWDYLIDVLEALQVLRRICRWWELDPSDWNISGCMLVSLRSDYLPKSKSMLEGSFFVAVVAYLDGLGIASFLRGGVLPRRSEVEITEATNLGE
ncbi:hypothetical protein Tco_0611475 [Tanacetum coccineum]